MRLARRAANGDFAHHLLPHLDAVVTNPPEVFTVLIGANDARASVADYPVEQTMKRNRLSERPSVGWCQQCLGAVVARLRAETDATIGLLSLPVLDRQLGQSSGGEVSSSRPDHIHRNSHRATLIAEVIDAGLLPRSE
ncbi:hypothetical protein [Streptomyces sp. NPDC055794]